MLSFVAWKKKKKQTKAIENCMWMPLVVGRFEFLGNSKCKSTSFPGPFPWGKGPGNEVECKWRLDWNHFKNRDVWWTQVQWIAIIDSVYKHLVLNRSNSKLYKMKCLMEFWTTMLLTRDKYSYSMPTLGEFRHPGTKTRHYLESLNISEITWSTFKGFQYNLCELLLISE